MTLSEISLKLREELIKNPTESNAQKIAQKIRKLKYKNGNLISKEDKQKILNYLRFGRNNENSNKIPFMENNSEFLKLVNIIYDLVNKKKGN